MLEEFSKLGSTDSTVSREAGKRILLHVSQNIGELEYAAKRLIMGLESHKIPTRTSSYSTLAVLLGMDKLKPGQLRELVQKVLVTNQDTTTKERRLVYIARILSSGVILRTVPLSTLLKEEDLLKGILTDLVDMGQKRSTLLKLATPFVCHVIGDEAVTQEVFDSVVWPCILPLFSKVEVKLEEEAVENTEESDPEKDQGICALHIALACAERGLKSDIEFLSDMDHVVRILLSERVSNIAEILELVVKHIMKTDLTETFWAALVPQIKSSHFDTVCVCVEKSVQAGIPQDVIAREEIVVPLLGVFLNDEASQQHTKAINALGHLLKWDKTEETKMGKKQRKSVLKVLFGGKPNLLHEYKILIRILNPFLANVCTSKDLTVLASIVEKQLNAETGLSVRMAIVYMQFLARIAQSSKASDELKIEIGKRLLNIGFGVEKLNFTKEESKEKAEGDDEDKEDDEEDEETELLIKKTGQEAVQSILAKSYNVTFLDQMFDIVIQEKDVFTEDNEVKKVIKNVAKLREKMEDSHLRYLLGAYALRVLLEQDNVLGEAKAAAEEIISIAKDKAILKVPSALAAEIVKFILNSASKEAQPPFDFEAMFSRLVIEDKITEEAVQAFADAIDVEVDDLAAVDEDSDEDSSDDDNEDPETKAGTEDDDSAESEDDEVQTPVPVKEKKKGKAKSKHDDVDSDSEEEDESINMDDATEEDLKNMDNALAKVFATKRKVKDEEHSEVRRLNRTFRLLESLLTRKVKGCNVSIPLMLLMPIVHSLQSSIRGKKTKELSTRIVTVLNKLNAIKKFEGLESIDSGTLFTMARDISTALKSKGNKMIADLLGDSVVMLTKCYAQSGQQTKGESTGFITLYTGMMALEDDTRNKSMGVIYNMVSSALTTLPGWTKGKDTICDKLLGIIFGPDTIRVFRKQQFMILLRAALSDKTHTADENYTEWKVDVMQKLVKSTLTYLATSPPFKKLTQEIMLTFNDSKSDPLLSKVVSGFVSKVKDNKSALSFLDKKEGNRIRPVLISLGILDPKSTKTLQHTESKEGKQSPKKRKAVSKKQTPKKKKSKVMQE